jgi:hypothetical protein
MEHLEPPASDPLPTSAPVRDIHADSDVPAEEKPTVRLTPPAEDDNDCCRNIHCACHHP